MMTLTRDQARQEVKARWREVIVNLTDRAMQDVNGEASYICPICGHGKGGDGLTRNPRSKDGNGLKCFGCDFSGDIIDLIRQHTGADYNTALSEAAGYLGIEIEPFRTDPGQDFNASKENKPEIGPNSQVNTGEHKTPTDAEKTPGQGQNEAGALSSTGTSGSGPDFTEYYRECAGRITDPAAAAYITGRGISIETAKRYMLGYDPKADPAGAPGATGYTYRPHPAPRLIIPVTAGHYIGRRIDGGQDYKKMNNKGAQIGIFNAKDALAPAADQDQGRPVFIVEGAIDALSIIEAGAEAVAINSTSNADLLLDTIDQAESRGPFILALDTDQAGRKAAERIKKGLEDRELPYIKADINGGKNDPNDALIADRGKFEADINEAQEEAKTAPAKRLPGLLSYEEAVNLFDTANDDYIEMKSFPKFSRAAKIGLHDSVVLAADTGAGKSSLAMNFLNDLNDEYPIIYFNLEMDLIKVLRRLVAIYLGGIMDIDTIEQQYKKDDLTADIVKNALHLITGRKPLQVLQSSDAVTVEDIEEIIQRSIKGREEPTVVFIDHSLLVNTRAANNSRYDRFTQISEKLRKMSLNNDIILFILLQQSREGKKDETERPRNSSLKESGSWENDATQICFLWYDPVDRRKKILLTKNRNGYTGGEFSLSYYSGAQVYTEVPENQTAQEGQEAAAGRPHNPTRRERQQQRLVNAYNTASIKAWGKPTLKDIAEAADVTTATVKGWIKEYGGCFIDGKQVDPAGINTEVELTGFVQVRRADNAPEEFTGETQDQPIKRF